MTDRVQTHKPKKKTGVQKAETELRPQTRSQQNKQKLKELDQYIEKVLQEAGEDFLDQFKQVEGE